MQLEEHVRQVQDQLTAAAALGDERTRQIAEGLAGAASAAVRLAIMDALSAATSEINTALLDAPGTPTVVLRLDGDELSIDVRQQSAGDFASAQVDDGDATARISLRLSDQLKSEVEAAAASESVSVNTWLVRSARAALGRTRGFDSGRGTHRISGWVTG